MSYSRTQKPYYSNNKPRASEKSDRWDHGGFDKLESEEKNKYFADSRKPKNRWNRDCGSTSESTQYTERATPEKVTSQPSDKWQHDKFDDIGSESKKEATSKPERVRRPDQALYRPPRQRGQNANLKRQDMKGRDTDSVDTNTDTASRLGSKNYFDLDTTVDFDTKCDEEKYTEERFSVCSESTAHSEKIKPEEYVSKSGSKQKESTICSTDVSPVDQSLASYPVFELSLTLFDGKMVDLRLFESNEEEFESIIDKFFDQHEIHGELRLHLKIYIVKCLRMQQVYDDKKLEALYDNLLSLNYKLIQENPEQISTLGLNYSPIPCHNDEDGLKEDELASF